MVELLVVVAIIAALVGIVAPLGSGIMSRSRTVKCANNMRQIGVATMLYASDNQMRLPVTSHQRREGGVSWERSLKPYVSGDNSVSLVFKCHEDPLPKRQYTYVINDFLTPNPAGAAHLNYSLLSKIDHPEASVMFAEASKSFGRNDHFHFSQYHGGGIPMEFFESEVAVDVHDGAANYLFADGHVETLSQKSVETRLATQGTRFVDPSGQ